MPGTGPRPRLAMREFCSALPLGAVAILALNDHVLKEAWPGIVTGKLSDVAGCFFFPLLLSALLGLVTRWPLARRLGAGAAVTAALLCAIKLSPAAADAVALALSALGRPFGLPASRIVSDPSDLLALPLAGLAVWYGLRAGTRGDGSGRQHLALAGRLVLLASTFALLTATSMARTCPEESGLVGGPVRLWAESSCGPSGEVVLRVEPHTCGASLEGGAAAGLPERGSVYWKAGHVGFSGDAPPGLDLPEDPAPRLSCWVDVGKREPWPLECSKWTEKNGKLRELDRCRGTLRRIRNPAAPDEPPEPPGS